MKRTRRRAARRLAGLGLALLTLGGCQTWTSGMTLPSGWYLQHQPQYFPPSPPFPLPRELSQQEAVWASPESGAPVGVLPPPVAGPVPLPP
jgi:hypothetical protein